MAWQARKCLLADGPDGRVNGQLCSKSAKLVISQRLDLSIRSSVSLCLSMSRRKGRSLARRCVCG